jgi:hypothetical protein
MPAAKSDRSAPVSKPRPASKPVVHAAPPPAKLFLVRCTFVGHDKAKQRVEGSFRFVIEAPDASAVQPRLEKAVRALRRSADLPPRCEIFVEFVLELADLKRGVIADFERWQKEPRQFQGGCITFSEACAVYQHGHNEPAFRFGSAPAPAAGAPVG